MCNALYCYYRGSGSGARPWAWEPKMGLDRGQGKEVRRPGDWEAGY